MKSDLTGIIINVSSKQHERKLAYLLATSLKVLNNLQKLELICKRI